MCSSLPNQQTSTAVRFYAGLALLDDFGVDTDQLVANLIANCPLAGMKTIHQAIAYGIYLHQYANIADCLRESSFSEAEIVFLQAIALIFQTNYPLEADRYCRQLAETCDNLTIFPELKPIYLFLSQGHSVGTAQYKISNPILLGIYLFLYSPYSWHNCQSIGRLYHLESSTMIVAMSLSRLFLGIIPTAKPAVKAASDRLFRFWSGAFNF